MISIRSGRDGEAATRASQSGTFPQNPCKVCIFRVYDGITEDALLQLDEDGAVEDGLDEDGDPTPPPEANISKYALLGVYRA